MRLNQFRDGLSQKRFAAELHAQGADLVRDDLVFRTLIEIRYSAGTARHFPGDAGDFLLGDVAIITIERLAGDGLVVGVQQNLDGAGHVGGVSEIPTQKDRCRGR